MRRVRLYGFLGLLILGGCDFGSPIKGGGGTEGEGLTGLIVDEGGSPVVGAWVRAYSADDSSVALAKAAQAAMAAAAWAMPLDSAQTNGAGRFLLKNLAAGTYNLSASVRRGDTTFSIFIRGVVYGGGRQDLGTDTLRVAAEASLQIYAEDEPLRGAVCFVPGSPYRAVTDAWGSCVLAGLAPGTLKISVYHPDYEISRSDSTGISAGEQANCGTLELTIPAGWKVVRVGGYDIGLPPDMDSLQTFYGLDSWGAVYENAALYLAMDGGFTPPLSRPTHYPAYIHEDLILKGIGAAVRLSYNLPDSVTAGVIAGSRHEATLQNLRFFAGLEPVSPSPRARFQVYCTSGTACQTAKRILRTISKT
jgi:hypothetical protein